MNGYVPNAVLLFISNPFKSNQYPDVISTSGLMKKYVVPMLCQCCRARWEMCPCGYFIHVVSTQSAPTMHAKDKHQHATKHKNEANLNQITACPPSNRPQQPFNQPQPPSNQPQMPSESALSAKATKGYCESVGHFESGFIHISCGGAV